MRYQLTPDASPETVVQAQFDAYNANDADALTAIYADDAQLFQHPATLMVSGAAQIRERYGARFALSRPKAKLLNRIVSGDMVFDHEIVTSESDLGPSSMEMVAIYQVRAGRIANAWFTMASLTQLRRAETADIPAMEALIARSGIELSEGFYTSRQAAAVTRHVFGVDTQLVEDQTYFLIEQDGKLVACGGWSKRSTLFGGDQTKNGPDPLLDPTTEPARIRAFFVDPKAARQGLGRMLLKHCTEQAALAGFHRLELAATLPGVPLYLAAGFEVAERFEIALPADSDDTRDADNADGGATQVHVPLARMSKAIGPAG